MRTKALLLSAALVAAGVASSMAQTSNVYSLNVVGYVNVVAPTGYSIVNNPLDSGNNTITNLFPAPANGTAIFVFTPGVGFVGQNFFNGWTTPSQQLAPGTGFFLFNPGAPVTNTFVGTVVQGTTTNSLASGYNLVGSTAPIAGVVDTGLNVPAVNGTAIFTYDPAAGFVGFNFFNGWAPSDPSVSVGQGFFVFQPVAVNWVQSFTVQ
jgi:hypothetical protein